MVIDPQSRPTMAFGTLGLVAFLATVYWCFTQPMNPDEMEHLHSTYLVLKGWIPYRDFWQNHTPTLWLLFAPFMAIWPTDASICYVARGIGLLGSILVFAATVRLSTELGSKSEPGRGSGGSGIESTASTSPPLGPTVAVIAAAYWGTSIPAETPIFRTDIWMTLFVLLAAIASVRVEKLLIRTEQKSERGTLGWCVAAGALLGLSLCFSTKLFPLVIALPVALLLRSGSVGRWIRCCFAYAFGGLISVIPLALYLFTTGSDSGFYRWVVVFNRMRSGSSHGFETWWIPALLASFAIVAVLALGTPRSWLEGNGARTKEGEPARAGFSPRAMLILAVFCSIFLYPLEARVFAYYVAPLIALGAAFLPSETWSLGSRFRASKIASFLLISVVFAAGAIPGAAHLWATRRPEHQLRKNLEFVQWMIDASVGKVVQCNVPSHPIYAFDLTPFYIPWQSHYLAQSGTPRSEMLLDLLRDSPPYDARLASEKPVLLQILVFRSHLSMLKEAGLIDEEGLDRVRQMILSDYRKVNDTFYVRRSGLP